MRAPYPPSHPHAPSTPIHIPSSGGQGLPALPALRAGDGLFLARARGEGGESLRRQRRGRERGRGWRARMRALPAPSHPHAPSTSNHIPSSGWQGLPALPVRRDRISTLDTAPFSN